MPFAILFFENISMNKNTDKNLKISKTHSNVVCSTDYTCVVPVLFN